MAIEPTPLGFLKPTGREAVRHMDNIQAHNAQLSDELIQELRQRLENFEGLAGMEPGDLSDVTMATVAADPNSQFHQQLQEMLGDNDFTTIDGGAP